MSQPQTASPPPGKPGSEPGGFGHSGRRVALEFFVIGAGLLVLLGAALYLAAHLAELAADQIPVDADVAIGAQAWSQVAPESRRCSNAAVKHYVEEVARPLVEAAKSPFTFQFTVVDDPEVNAFALPGGFLTVNIGLLEKAQSGEEVAAVLGHEIAHVTQRHGTRRIARQAGTSVLISILFGGSDFEALSHAAGGLVVTAYDRDQEASADEEGQALLRAAGISPAAMADFFARLAADGVSVPVLLSTHPDPGDRAARARAAAEGFTPTRMLPSPAGLSCKG